MREASLLEPQRARGRGRPRPHDAPGNVYYIRGALWFGGAFNANTGGETFTDTEKFQIVQRGGGTVDSVNITVHMSPNGDFRFFDFGTCVSPADEE